MSDGEAPPAPPPGEASRPARADWQPPPMVALGRCAVAALACWGSAALVFQAALLIPPPPGAGPLDALLPAALPAAGAGLGLASPILLAQLGLEGPDAASEETSVWARLRAALAVAVLGSLLGLAALRVLEWVPEFLCRPQPLSRWPFGPCLAPWDLRTGFLSRNGPALSLGLLMLLPPFLVVALAGFVVTLRPRSPAFGLAAALALLWHRALALTLAPLLGAALAGFVLWLTGGRPLPGPLGPWAALTLAFALPHAALAWAAAPALGSVPVGGRRP